MEIAIKRGYISVCAARGIGRSANLSALRRARAYTQWDGNSLPRAHTHTCAHQLRTCASINVECARRRTLSRRYGNDTLKHTLRYIEPLPVVIGMTFERGDP